MHFHAHTAQPLECKKLHINYQCKSSQCQCWLPGAGDEPVVQTRKEDAYTRKEVAYIHILYSSTP